MSAMKRVGMSVTIALFLFINMQSAMADKKDAIFTDVPEAVDPAGKYLFYMHGAWIETKGLMSAHPKHGAYEYEKIVQTFARKGFVVISEARFGEVRHREYANKIASQVQVLLEKGVPPGNITVIGHSKGGNMALITASILNEAKVNFVVMAGCGEKGTMFRRSFEKFLRRSAPRMSGRILSLYDAADRSAGTCREAFDRADHVESREVVFKTGRGHGLFYSPQSVWVEEVVQWSNPDFS
jgi:hypothetical protein